ncbi:MAG: hypothetical protein R3F14_39540 [Polyangiaceae bacterium]
MRVHFFDSTDPDGFDRHPRRDRRRPPETLTVIHLESGGTKETRNGMLEAEAAYKRAGLTFAKHAVATSPARRRGNRSPPPRRASRPLPHVGLGRRSHQQTEAPSASCRRPANVDVSLFLAGARAVDEIHAPPGLRKDFTALLALAWYARHLRRRPQGHGDPPLQGSGLVFSAASSS